MNWTSNARASITGPQPHTPLKQAYAIPSSGPSKVIWYEVGGNSPHVTRQVQYLLLAGFCPGACPSSPDLEHSGSGPLSALTTYLFTWSNTSIPSVVNHSSRLSCYIYMYQHFLIIFFGHHEMFRLTFAFDEAGSEVILMSELQCVASETWGREHSITS